MKALQVLALVIFTFFIGALVFTGIQTGFDLVVISTLVFNLIGAAATLYLIRNK